MTTARSPHVHPLHDISNRSSIVTTALSVSFPVSLLTAALVAPTLACGGADYAGGTVDVTVYGEAFIEEGIPEEVFSDGWAVTFDRFLISIGDATMQAGHDADELSAPGMRIVDLAEASDGVGYLLSTTEVPGGRYDHFGYRIAPAADATGVSVDAADVDAMVDAGASMWIVGSATNGEVTKTFDWQFDLALRFAECEVDDLVDGDGVTMQATIHADHLFYDDAVSETPNVTFQALADADDAGDADGEVTLAELDAVDITGFERYQVGSLDIEDLGAFVRQQATTVGHVNGEGHCADVEVE